MKLKVFCMALACLCPVTVFAAADDAAGHERHHGENIEHLTRELGLSADQKTKLESIFVEHREKIKALRLEKRKQLEGVLSHDQITKYEELVKQGHKGWHNKPHHGGGDKSPAQL